MKRRAGRAAAAAASGGRLLTLLALLCMVAATAFAGPYEDAVRQYAQRDYRAAVQSLQEARRADPDNPKIYIGLGKSYRKLGDDDAARQAYDELIRLDPTLRSVPANEREAFVRAYRSIGGTMQPQQRSGSGARSGSTGSGGRVTANDIILALSQGDVYVHPDLKGEVNVGELENAAAQARPNVVKILAVANIGTYRTRSQLADDLRKRLNLPENAIVIVGTPEGVSAASGRLSNEQLKEAFQRAGVDTAFAQGGLGGALVRSAEAVQGTVQTDIRQDRRREETTRNTGAGIVFLGLAGVAGFLAFRSHKKKQELEAVREPLLAAQRKVLDNLSYVDGYLDLLPKGEDAERARALRASAYEEYAAAKSILEQGATMDEVRRARPMLDTALQQLEQCRVHIDKATGGTGVAMAIPEIPSLATDAEKAAERLKPVEDIRDQTEAERYQREIESIPPEQRGVSFFSGRPMPADQLVPVTIVIQGQKRTVMATREEAEAIQRGETPPVRAFQDERGQYVPWYENQRYDPYRDYYGGWGYGGGGLGTLVNLYLLTSLFGGGMFGGYGGWGWGGYGWGMPGGYYGGGWGHNNGGWDNGGGAVFGGGGGEPAYVEPEHTGGIDFFGNQGYDERSESGGFGFDPGESFDFGGGGGSDDGGGFDFGGGGDFGGGDFGGGDFGGGGDW